MAPSREAARRHGASCCRLRSPGLAPTPSSTRASTLPLSIACSSIRRPARRRPRQDPFVPRQLRAARGRARTAATGVLVDDGHVTTDPQGVRTRGGARGRGGGWPAGRLRRHGYAPRRRRRRRSGPWTALPSAAAAGVVAASTSTISSATRSKSEASKPRDVRAGVPSRMPDVYQAPFGSLGTLLRLVTMPASRSADSAWRPVSP